MSYILDALRRADAERKLGDVPTLHAAATPWLDDPPSEPGPRRAAPWVVIALAALAAAIAVALVAWWVWPAAPEHSGAQPHAMGEAATPAARPGAPPDVAASAPPARDGTPASGAASVPVAQSATAAPPALPAAPKPAGSAAPPAPAAAAQRPPAGGAEGLPAARSTPPAEPRRAAPAPVARPAPSPPVAAAAVERIPRIDQLPPDQRQALPALAVSGAVYSADPASRMLIINGQLVREGDRLSADLVLVRIQPKSAVLESQGQRFSIAF